MAENRNNLETLVISMSATEQSRARKFLQSPYHNSRQDVIDLFELLLDHRNHELSKEDFFSMLFGNTHFVAKKLRYVRSELLDLLRQFAAIDELKRDPSSFAILQATSMLDRKQYGQVRKLFKTSEKGLHSTIGQAAQLNTYLLSKQQLRMGFDHHQFDHQLLEKHSADLTAFFILQKLRLFCLAETYRIRFPAEFNFPLKEEILKLLEGKHHQLDNALIALYLSAFKMLSTDDSLQHFTDLKSGIIALEENIEADSLKELYLIAINYVIGRINRGEEMFKEIFQLYQHGITHEIFLEDGELSPGTYRNIVLAGLRLEEFKWIDAFLDDFRDKLPPHNRLHHYRYNRAVFAFRKKNYPETFDLLQRVRTQDVHMNLDMRRMQTIMYFEEKDFEVLEHHLESLLRYLRRHKKEMTYHHAIWADFVRATRMLIRIQYGQKDLNQQLVTFLQEHKALPSRGWLLGQVR